METLLYAAELVPADATITASRITTPLFGLGLVDAVRDEYLLNLARVQAVTTPRTAGRLRRRSTNCCQT